MNGDSKNTKKDDDTTAEDVIDIIETSRGKGFADQLRAMLEQESTNGE